MLRNKHIYASQMGQIQWADNVWQVTDYNATVLSRENNCDTQYYYLVSVWCHYIALGLHIGGWHI